jgi:hypothetical protein
VTVFSEGKYGLMILLHPVTALQLYCMGKIRYWKNLSKNGREIERDRVREIERDREKEEEEEEG